MKRGMLIKVILLFVLSSGLSNAADILFLCSSYCSNSTLNQFDVACRFYGLEAKKILVEDSYYDEDTLLTLIESEKIKAIVISADLLDLYEIQNTFIQKPTSLKINIPVLIADITSEIDPALLDLWSNDSIIECTEMNSNSKGYLAILKNIKITAQLGGYFLPYKMGQIYQLKLNENSRVESLVKISNSSRLQSIFSKINYDTKDVFFLSRLDALTSSENTNWKFRHNNFFQYAPWLFFLRYCCNDRRFHVSDRFANFTVDDPWLTDHYGYFSFSELLTQMQKNNFHTTIAFIPWNFDRSKKEVINLISSNPDRFSICIHGNNHDQKEFNEYNLDFGDFAKPSSIKEYEYGIKQALARMERFNELTDLPFDKIMVFPHEVAPAKALSILKKYNFLATVNSMNVPPDSLQGLDPVWKLRSINNLYDNFPNFERYKADEISPIDIAIDLFLGNPILIYAHHDYFKEGIDRFNLIARKINRLHPGIKWASLGEIADEMYLERRSSEGAVEIVPFSNKILLKNKSELSKTFTLIKPESDLKSIKQITINGKPCNYSISRGDDHNNTSLIILVDIAAGQTCRVLVEYKNSFNINEIDISKNDWNINILRQFADFRDMSFSTSLIGQLITGIYYESGFGQLGLKRGLIVFLIILSVIVVIIKYLITILRKGSEHPDHQKA